MKLAKNQLIDRADNKLRSFNLLCNKETTRA